MSYRDELRAQLKIDEGVRPHPYKDTRGILTIGVGRNLEAVGLRPHEIDYLLDNDIDEAEACVRGLLPNFGDLNVPRQLAMVDMAFNLGATRFAGFKKMLSAMRQGLWADAARELLDSDAGRELPTRYERLADMVETGCMP